MQGFHFCNVAIVLSDFATSDGDSVNVIINVSALLMMSDVRIVSIFSQKHVSLESQIS